MEGRIVRRQKILSYGKISELNCIKQRVCRAVGAKHTETDNNANKVADEVSCLEWEDVEG